ncbi:TonB-dependent receptor plug domain-containing protein [Aurantibacillus circumpalustris]|uniref:TonB-dependent receptor plug domain-containing protein n=1 Tax=Aurantibacillus circumpalustris TaxID=3036359 RepID=UPI00295B05D8|nr:TonB-dependent receptor plug domain-containing protein [Aurantibacillus circumpalustris]
MKGTDGEALERVVIGVKEDTKITTYTNEKGFYSLSLESGKIYTLVYYDISHTAATHTLEAKGDQTITYSPVLDFKNTFETVEVRDFKTSSQEIVVLDPKIISRIPGPSESVESIIKTQAGVSSNNELSSGYSVRGGNFDENLVYVNDIEVYRPFLVRSGQQEGLSFANPNMVSNIVFSAGGFDAKYGDKLSSVLDITYRKPLKFAGNASASFLGGNVQLEGISKNRLIAWNIGGRYRTNSYLLSSLDTKLNTSGGYRPSATDFQSFLTFDVNPKLKIEFLGNIASNKYLVKPVNRETDFGTVKDALRLTIYFDGQELMQYNTYMGGLSTTYRPNSKTKLKLIGSAYRANEQEVYTIQGQYYIDQLEADLGKPNFGQVAYNRGVGTFLNNGRNYLTASVYNLEHKGTRTINRNNEFLWGVREQYEKIEDKLGEWRTVDSAGYIVPYAVNEINLTDVYKTQITLPSWRSQGYMQFNHTATLRDSSNFRVSAGVRANHWTVNNQTVFSPRVSMAYKPNWKRDWLFKLSGGFYYQPPFYRELRNIDGTINKDVKAQRSIHIVFTSDYVFKMWNRPFKLMMSGYYKSLNDLVPYEIENVRIRYFANNNTQGYATGADIRINGEFVKGVESWATIGVLKTYEYSKDNIHYDYYNKDGEKIVRGYTFDQVRADSQKVDPGFIPRPTDQLITFGLFFQDNIPKFPAIKFNLNIQFGSGLPFGPPTHTRWQQVLRMPPYRRADAGLAYNVLKENREFKRKNYFNNLKEMWIFLEVFNLLQIQNTVSYTWIADVTGNRYAVPNYLTNRQVNVKLQIRF